VAVARRLATTGLPLHAAGGKLLLPIGWTGRRQHRRSAALRFGLRSDPAEGDNSDQCANIQGVANTGNAQNQIDLIQYASDADDFEFDEVGSNIDVSPSNSAECDQQVNQAAFASG
jgi:hypothetical protein